jgi:LPS-assembly protein
VETVRNVKRNALLLTTVLPLLWLAGTARAQDLQDRAVLPPPPSETPVSQESDEIQFSSDQLEYDSSGEIVTVTGDVRFYRQGDRLRADKVVWNRQTGKVMASGDIAVTNPQGDTVYGDAIELTDTLKDGVIDNMLVVLEQGGRLAARRGERDNGVITVDDAAYTPCAVVDSENCPKEPSWKITAVKVVYDPAQGRIRYKGARVALFGLPTLPLPAFSHPVGGKSDDGFLMPDIRFDAVNGLEVAVPYFFSLAPNRDLTVTPRVFSSVAPMIQAQYRQLTSLGAFSVLGYGTYSRRSDDNTGTAGTGEESFRGYIDGIARFQLDPYWSASASLRLSSDRTFLRRYDISREDRLRNNFRIERRDDDSYLSVNTWAVQTLRSGDRQGFQPIALPEVDYRRRFDDGLLGGKFEAQINTLAITRSAGQDTQRAFASLRWDLRKLTAWGQEVTFTAYGRADVYNADDTLSTTVASYRGTEGFRARGIGALAIDVKWPLIGPAFGGTQRITPRFQIVASPRIENMEVPNEDARAVDLEDSNLFALNRFAGYDRFEDSTRFTLGVDYALYLPGFSIDANVGQSYRLDSRPTLLPSGTGLDDKVSDIVGRTVIRYRDFLSFTHRYRLDKDGLAIRRNEIDATVGTRSTYLLLGYLRLNRNISTTAEDLQDREEIRVGGRVQVARFWSIYASTMINLTDRDEDPRSLSDGYEPVRHRIGVAYEDDCLKLGVTWRRDYEDAGDARSGSSYLLTLAFKNLGR